MNTATHLDVEVHRALERKHREALPSMLAIDVLPPATHHGGTQDDDLFRGVSTLAGTQW